MSSIIKSGSWQGLQIVRPVNQGRTGGVPADADPERYRLERRLAELEAEILKRDGEVERLQQENAHIREARFSEGYEKGLRDADSRENDRLHLLGVALNSALGDYRNNLAGCEALAVLVARECLEKLLGDTDHRLELLTGMIGYRIREIDRTALVSVDVSAEDFSDEDALNFLVGQTGLDKGIINILPGLRSGDCTVSLRLGQIEVGLNQQLESISALLAEMADPGAVA